MKTRKGTGWWLGMFLGSKFQLHSSYLFFDYLRFPDVSTSNFVGRIPNLVHSLIRRREVSNRWISWTLLRSMLMKMVKNAKNHFKDGPFPTLMLWVCETVSRSFLSFGSIWYDAGCSCQVWRDWRSQESSDFARGSCSSTIRQILLSLSLSLCLSASPFAEQCEDELSMDVPLLFGPK